MSVLKCSSTFTILIVFLCGIINGQNVEKCSFAETGTIKAHSTICGAYLECVNEQYIERKCAPHLLFNSHLKRCDWEDTVTCDQIISPTINPAPPNVTDPTTTTTPTPTPTPPPPPNHTYCPAVDPENYTVYLPHPNCSLYYICLYGSPILVSCPPGTHWSITYNWCDFPEYANCIAGIAPTQLPPNTTLPTTPTPTFTPPPSINYTSCPAVDPINYTVHLPHPNCSLFYQCEYGEPLELSCPPGLHWNTVNDQCDFPDIANCTYGAAPTQRPPNMTTPTYTPTPSTLPTAPPPVHTYCPVGDPQNYTVFLPHPNCTSYYICLNGYPIVHSCAPGLHWSAEHNRCDYPEYANCTDGVAPPQLPPNSTTTVPTPTPTPTPTWTPPPIHTYCPAIDPENYTVHLPHPNCSVFYKCEHGQAFEIPCPPGLHWSITYNQCDFPENANCTYGAAPTQAPPNVTESTTIGTPTPTWAPPPIHTYCPAVDPENYTVHLPHPNCSIFYKCEHGEAFEIPCPPGLHWSIAYDRCDFPETANCTYGAAPTQAPPNATDPITTPSPTPSLPPYINYTQCPETDPMNYTVHLPHPNCTLFYKCERGQPIEVSCAPGLHWSVTAGQCDFPEYANCTGDAPVQPISVNPQPNIEKSCPQSGTAFLPHPDCNLYYLCINGEPIEVSCPIGYHWSTSITSCDLPYYANCVYFAAPPQQQQQQEQLTTVIAQTSTTPEIINTTLPNTIVYGSCKNDGSLIHVLHLPHPDCSRYYRCQHGVPLEEKCPVGLHWNQEKSSCDFINSANCIPNQAPIQA